MAPLILIKPSFTQIPLIADGRGVQSGEQRVDLLTGDTVVLTINSVTPIDFGIGDSVPIYGQLYTLNAEPTVRKEGERRYVYELTLEGPQYHLIRPVFFDTDTTGIALSSTLRYIRAGWVRYRLQRVNLNSRIRALISI